jgi:streptogramin lyase
VVSEFAIPTLGCNAQWITTGPDGNLWFTEEDGDQLGRVTPAGVITEFPLPANTTPLGIVRGPDGNLWFTESGPDNIARFNPADPGSVTTFYTGQANSAPSAITVGADGNLWFMVVGGNDIGRITTGGTISMFSLPTGETSWGQIAPGPDGNVWFAEYTNNMGVITPNGTITEYPLPTVNGVGVSPAGVCAGPFGTVVFTEKFGNRLGEITTGQSDNFITSLYQHDLGRSAALTEINAWESVLMSQGDAAVVLAIGHSREADVHLVDSLYMRYLGRQADPGGEAAFVNYLQSGGTEEGVLSGILGSPEYFNRVTAGSATPVVTFVESLYQNLLGRAPTVAEANAWANAVGSLGAPTVVADFASSFEYRSDVVTSYYMNLLHRAPASAEVAAWAGLQMDLYSMELIFETTGEYFLNGR